MDEASMQRPYTFKVDVLATPSQAENIAARISRALCADEPHAGKCVNPWSVDYYDVYATIGEEEGSEIAEFLSQD